jgi:integrase
MNHTTLHRAAPRTRPVKKSADPIAEELRRYDEHLRDVRGLAAVTRRDRIRIAHRFLGQHFAGRAIKIAALQPDDVRQFLTRQLDSHRTIPNAASLAAALRNYLRYRGTCGDRVDALTAVISSPVHWKLATLPRALKPDETERLLNSFTGDLRWPKRSYAIVRCALDMGLRCCEIAHLQIGDIDWRDGTVTLRGTKSLCDSYLKGNTTRNGQ